MRGKTRAALKLDLISSLVCSVNDIGSQSRPGWLLSRFFSAFSQHSNQTQKEFRTLRFSTSNASLVLIDLRLTPRHASLSRFVVCSDVTIETPTASRTTSIGCGSATPRASTRNRSTAKQIARNRVGVRSRYRISIYR